MTDTDTDTPTIPITIVATVSIHTIHYGTGQTAGFFWWPRPATPPQEEEHQ